MQNKLVQRWVCGIFIVVQCFGILLRTVCPNCLYVDIYWFTEENGIELLTAVNMRFDTCCCVALISYVLQIPNRNMGLIEFEVCLYDVSHNIIV